MSYKVLIIVADGLGDRVVPQLGGRTPLEVAKKPSIDRLASQAITGLWDPIAPGIRPGSDTAHLSLFGINPVGNYPGRGPFEALGAGAELRPGDIALRGNFATVNEDLIVLDRRAGRYLPENKVLAKYLNEHIGEINGIKVEFYPATEHRLAVVLRGEGLSPKVSDTDPHKVGVKVLESRPLVNTEEAKRTAEIINRITKLTFELLKDHEVNRERIRKGLPPANIVLLRGAGSLFSYPKIYEREFFRVEKAVAISATAMIKGVCKLLGFEVVTPKGATGGVDTNVNSKFEVAIKYLNKNYDLVYVHIKGTDSASHDRRPDLKVMMIEKIDRGIKELLKSIDLNDVVLVFTGDHTTPIVVGDHTGDPVPLLIYAPYIIPDNVKTFNERSVRSGGLGRIRGSDLINVVMDLANKSIKFGA